MNQTNPDWTEYQALFDGLDETIWLNHAGVSPISSAVANAMAAHLDEVRHKGAAGTSDWYRSLTDIRRLAAGLIGASPRDIAVTPNTTHGINLVANGLDWREGDEVLLAEKEYPANVYPWWAQKDKGVRLVWVDETPDHHFPIEAYEAKMTDRTRVVAVSHVQFASGFRCDLERLGRICRERGILLFVDAIQSFSVFDIRVEDWGIDALVTGSHKWLLGPTGVALFYTTADLRDRLRSTHVGADSMVDALNYLDYRFELQPDARRFENAMINFPGAAGLRAALEVVHRFGRGRIEAGIRENTDRLRALLVDLGFEDHSLRGDGEWSGILSFTHPRDSCDRISESLKRRGVFTSVRDHRLRLSPHAYHREEAFERIEAALIETLKES